MEIKIVKEFIKIIQKIFLNDIFEETWGKYSLIFIAEELNPESKTNHKRLFFWISPYVCFIIKTDAK